MVLHISLSAPVKQREGLERDVDFTAVHVNQHGMRRTLLNDPTPEASSSQLQLHTWTLRSAAVH